MEQENLKKLIADGLIAMKAGGQVAAAATDEIQQSATNADLKSALDAGNDTAKTWQTRIERSLDELGAEGEGENPILDAHYQVSKKIRDSAPDEQVRDLGIIASGQLALHYWVAAFGTMKAYAGRLGLEQTEQEMARSVEEAKRADEQHTAIAARIMG